MERTDHRIANMTDLANLIRGARLAQGLTRDELYHATGLSPKFITHLEAGKPTAQIGKVMLLLRELGVALYADPVIEISKDIAAKATRRRRTNRDNTAA